MLVVAGWLLLCVGAGMWQPPAGLVVAGAGLVAAGLLLVDVEG
jgi:hypothetical protein